MENRVNFMQINRMKNGSQMKRNSFNCLLDGMQFGISDLLIFERCESLPIII